MFGYYRFLEYEMENKAAKWWLFFIGLGSLTQINIGFSIGISEIFVYILAPFIYVKEFSVIKRQGMLFIVNFGILVSIMCVISGLYNHTPIYFIFKGLASTYPLFAFPVVLHHLLRKNMHGLGWLLLGVAISNVINIFMFQTSVEMYLYAGGHEGMRGAAAAEGIMNGPIFWIGRLSKFVMLPIAGWFLSTPTTYSIVAPLGLAAFSILTSESGRSAALGALGGAAIMIVAGKTQNGMRRLGRNFYLLLIVAVLGLFVVHASYRYAATHKLLGEKAADKYELQTKGNDGMLRLLMGGRGEFFIGFLAALEKPLIGHGPWAFDRGEHTLEFLNRYGDDEDYQAAVRSRQYAERVNGGMVMHYIPAHSHLVSFWLWFGVVGLSYWLYVLYMIFRYLRRETTAIPQWFGFLAVGAPPMLWALFFSGFGFRISTLPYVVALVMAHNIARGKIPLPEYMLREIK